MKIKYEAPKGRRLKKQFMCLEVDEEKMYWYREDIKQWRTGMDVYKDKALGTWTCSSVPCRSLKAAIRKINSYDLPKGTKFKLCSRWVGYDIYITK